MAFRWYYMAPDDALPSAEFAELSPRLPRLHRLILVIGAAALCWALALGGVWLVGRVYHLMIQ